MEKVEIKVEIKNIAFLENNMYNVIGNFDIQKRILSYNEDDSTNVNIFYDDEMVSLIRKNKELDMELNFKLESMEKGHYYIREMDSYILLKVYTKSLKRETGKIEIEYQLIIDKDIIESIIIIEWKR